MRELALIGTVIICACSQISGEQSECPSSGEFYYKGVALTTESGDSTLALASDCVFFVSGPENYYRSVRDAWKKSPYRDEIRPIYLSATGTVQARDGLADLFVIKSVQEVSVNFTSHDARDQFQLRMARDPEEYR